MADFPAMPFFSDAYLADTMHLSFEQHGVYHLLLHHAWRNGARLPNDPTWIAKRLLCSPETYSRVVEPVLREFFQTDGNWWFQKRQQREYAYCKAKSRKQSDRAKSRWDKEKDRCRGNAAPQCPPPHPTPPNTESESLPTASSSSRAPAREEAAAGAEPIELHPARVDEALIEALVPRYEVQGRNEAWVRAKVAAMVRERGSAPAVARALDKALDRSTGDPIAYAQRVVSAECIEREAAMAQARAGPAEAEPFDLAAEAARNLRAQGYA